MKNTRRSFLFSVCSLMLALGFSSPAFSTVYKADLSHSGLEFEIRHLASKVKGRFEEFSGEFSFDEKKPASLSEIKFKVPATSIYTSNKKRDEHLRSEDFFNVKKYPEIQFTSKKVTAGKKTKTGQEYKIEGDLTMLGITKSVTWDAQYLGSSENPYGGTASGFSAKTKLNRKDFGMVWNKALDKGGVVLGEEVDVTINLEAYPEVAEKK